MRSDLPVRTTILATCLVAVMGAGAAAVGEVDAKRITVASGTVVGEPFDVTFATWNDETGQMTGRRLSVAVESTDPRLSGILTMASTGAGERYGDGAIVILRSTYHLANDEGAWIGQGWEAEARPAPDQAALFRSGDMLLEGDGAYVGLSAYVSVAYDGEVPMIEAVVIESTLPPMPDPVAAG